MEFKIFNTESDERAVGDFGESTYEDMYEAASRDVWKLMPIAEWVEKLDLKFIKLAVLILEEEGYLAEANALRFWLKGKPE